MFDIAKAALNIKETLPGQNYTEKNSPTNGLGKSR
jgi:hypothetical protein